MAPYIFTERNGIYIVDLQKTVKKLEEATTLSVILLPTETLYCLLAQKQAQDSPVKKLNDGMFYVNARWLGACLQT